MSEYGLRNVSRPVHLNRVLREAGLITIRDEQGLELLDAGASAAFAVADHQVAHVYVNDAARVAAVRDLLARSPWRRARARPARTGRAGTSTTRARAISSSSPNRTRGSRITTGSTTARAPDFARTVDIHRKPGYDPVELFLDPAISMPALTVGWKLAKRKLGLRTLLDVIPLDASLVRGSHGRQDAGDHGPLCLTRRADGLGADTLRSVDVFDVMLRHLVG